MDKTSKKIINNNRSSKIVRLLSTLNAKEIAHFAAFLKSPFLNSNKRLITLFTHLRLFYPAFDSPQYTKEKIFKKVYGRDKPYDENTLNVLYAHLVKAFYKYLTINALEEDDFRKEQLLCEALEVRQLKQEFNKHLCDLEKKIPTTALSRTELLLRKYESRFEQIKGWRKAKIEQLGDSLHDLEQLFIYEKLRTAIFFENNRRLTGKEIDYFLLAPIMENIDKQRASYAPIILIWRDVIQLQQEYDSALLLKVIAFFSEHITELTREEQNYIIKSLLTILAQESRMGKKEVNIYTLKLYNLGLSHKSLIVGDFMSDVTFTNISSLIYELKGIVAMDAFLECYAIYLPDEKRRETVYLCRLIALFGKATMTKAKEDFKACLEVVDDIVFSGVQTNIRVRLILLRVYFELYIRNDEDAEEILKYTHTFEQYIRRQELWTLKKENHLNFILFCKNIIIISTKLDRTAGLAALEKRITATKNVFKKNWLLEKIEELKTAPQ